MSPMGIALIIFLGVLLIVSGSLGVNQYNRCKDLNNDTVASGEKGFMIALILVGIIFLLYAVWEIV